MSVLQTVARKWLSDVYWFSRLVIRRPLYNYQLGPARAIVGSIIHRQGLEFAVMFPRQSGKNETQSQVEAYLLNLFQRVPGAQIVKAQPTYKPQAVNAMMRLERALANDWNKGQWRKREGYMYQLGQALIAFFSAEPSANAVGATASLLLECDEAQDVLEAEWQKKFVPMGASTNATIVYWGTAWTSRTLLARTIRALRELEAIDGLQRVFIVTPEQVAEENPAYGQFVARQVAKLGRTHPLVKTQFYNEEIDAEGGMFPPARRALMQGDHAPQIAPTPGRTYAMLLDVAGEDEGAITGSAVDAGDVQALSNPRRDSTCLTIVDVDLATLSDPTISRPTYRAVGRFLWTGVKHSLLYGILRSHADLWRPRYLVVDATGVGAGLASFLEAALPPGVVIPFDFTPHSKSQLGWDFLAICDTGRWKDYQPPAAERESETFWRELEFCQYEVVPGPSRLLRWSVPEGTRDPATTELVHDDTVLSAALAGVLDQQPWFADTGPGTIIRAPDPLDELSRGF